MPVVALAALGAIVAIPALSSSLLHAAGSERFASVIVHRGDTLWTLAESHTPAGGSIQETIDTILAVNQLDGAAVVPGQQIRIPR
jgi:nucleoid-associated protein YgaU